MFKVWQNHYYNCLKWGFDVLTIICEKCDKIKQEELKEKYTRCPHYGDPEYWCYKEFYSVRLLYESMYSAQTERMLTYEEVFGK